MPITSKVTGIDLEKMTPAERQAAVLHGFADLDRFMKAGPLTSPPEKPTEKPAEAFNVIGKEQKDLEGYKIVTGKARFTVDIYFPDMLFVKVKRSPFPHANVKSIDTSKAEKMPGVHAV